MGQQCHIYCNFKDNNSIGMVIKWSYINNNHLEDASATGNKIHVAYHFHVIRWCERTIWTFLPPVNL